MASLCVHEAAHAVMMICTGERIGSIEVSLNFERAYGGGVYASVRGACSRAGVARGSRVSPSSVALEKPDKVYVCWRAFCKGAIVSAGGPAGEQKFRAQAELPHAVVGISDGADGDTLNWYSRVILDHVREGRHRIPASCLA
jgi:hypothetical protein